MLNTRLVAIIKGRRLFEVQKESRSLFVGSAAECQRFVDLHEEKVQKSMRNRRRRNRPMARIYRVWARPAAASGM